MRIRGLAGVCRRNEENARGKREAYWSTNGKSPMETFRRKKKKNPLTSPLTRGCKQKLTPSNPKRGGRYIVKGG